MTFLKRDWFVFTAGISLGAALVFGFSQIKTSNPCVQLRKDIKIANTVGFQLWETYNQAVGKYVSLDLNHFEQKMAAGNAVATAFVPLAKWDMELVTEMYLPRYGKCVSYNFSSTISAHLARAQNFIDFYSGKTKDASGFYFSGEFNTSIYSSFFDYSKYLV